MHAAIPCLSAWGPHTSTPWPKALCTQHKGRRSSTRTSASHLCAGPRSPAPSTRAAAAAPGPQHPLQECQLPNGFTIRHTSTQAEAFFLYDEVYAQQQYLQQGIELKQGDTVLDVGANIGLMSMLAAEAVGPLGRIVSVEPVPQTAAALELNLLHHAQWCAAKGQQVAPCTVLRAAVTDSSHQAEAQLTVYSRAPGWSTLSPDEVEVANNMRGYINSLLTQPTPPDAGWSPLQTVLVWLGRQLARLPGGLSDAMASLYVKLALLQGAATITVPATTVSGIITDLQLDCVNLLKVDVERAELLVLQGIEDQHWPCIQQVAMEVHDMDNRVADVVALLKQHGFTRVVVQQPENLTGTDLYNLYALRTQQPAG